MHMNAATAFAILAFTGSALAQYDNYYSYGNEIYARDVVPDYEDYGIYAREAEAEPEYEDDEDFHLSARDDEYLEEVFEILSRRQANKTPEDPLKKMAAQDTKDAANLSKQADDEKHKAEHDRHLAKLAKMDVQNDKTAIEALQAKLKQLEGKMKVDKETYRQKRKKAHAEMQNSKKLSKQANDKKVEAKALTTRELIEEYLGYAEDY